MISLWFWCTFSVLTWGHIRSDTEEADFDKTSGKKDLAFVGIFNYAANPQGGVATWEADSDSHYVDWYESVKRLGLKGMVLHDNAYSASFTSAHADPALTFVKVDLEAQGLYTDPAREKLSPTVWKFVALHDYILAHHAELEYVILTDSRDVVFRKDPFKYMRALDGAMDHKYIYGQEEWRPWLAFSETDDPVKDASKTAFGLWAETYKQCFEKELPAEALAGRLPNAGILGGHVDVVLPFLDEMLKWYASIPLRKRDDYACGMADALAYLRTVEQNYGDRFVAGYPFHAKFKHNDPLEYAVIYHKAGIPRSESVESAFGGVYLREDRPLPNEDTILDDGNRYKDASGRALVFIEKGGKIIFGTENHGKGTSGVASSGV